MFCVGLTKTDFFPPFSARPLNQKSKIHLALTGPGAGSLLLLSVGRAGRNGWRTILLSVHKTELNQKCVDSTQPMGVKGCKSFSLQKKAFKSL